MQKSLIFVALLASCLAAPTVNNENARADVASLQRPSPINPAVPSDPKPAERIIMITDPQEMSKHKRESDSATHGSKTPLKPTVSSYTEEHLLANEGKPSSGSTVTDQRHRVARDSKTVASNKQPSVTRVPTSKSSSPQKTNSDAAKTQVKAAAQKPTSVDTTQKHRPKRNNPHPSAQPVPLIYRDQHQKPSTPSTPTEPFGRPQTQPAHVDAKRDIPVPLVPKHPHPEESPKEDNSKEKTAEEKQTNVTKEHSDNKGEVQAPPHSPQPHLEHHEPEAAAPSTSTTGHPLIRHHPVPVAELFARSKSQSTN